MTNQHLEVTTAAAHILHVLDNVTAQLAEIRETAERLRQLQESDADASHP